MDYTTTLQPNKLYRTIGAETIRAVWLSTTFLHLQSLPDSKGIEWEPTVLSGSGQMSKKGNGQKAAKQTLEEQEAAWQSCILDQYMSANAVSKVVEIPGELMSIQSLSYCVSKDISSFIQRNVWKLCVEADA